MNRDNFIQLFRALLTLGICMLHAITRYGHPNQCLDGQLSACVDGVVFISFIGFCGFPVLVCPWCFCEYSTSVVLLLVFAGCNVFDILRRVLIVPFRVQIDSVLAKIDGWYERLFV